MVNPLQPKDLTITKTAFVRIFETFRNERGMSRLDAFCAATNYVEDLGYNAHYTDLSGFDKYYYKQLQVEMGR